MTFRHPPPTTRYCSRHRSQAPTKGGEYQTSSNGLTRQWICAACIARRAMAA